MKAGVVSIVEKGKNTPTYKSVLEKGNQINAHLIEKAAQIIEGEKIKVEQLQNENQTVYNDDKGTVVGEDSDEGRD